MISLSLTAARNLQLAAQGLLHPAKSKASKAEVLACIRRMGVLQIDTISVVARSPYLVLWSRLGDYPLNWLDQHLAEKNLFEYWSHEACFIPIEHFGRYRHQMLQPDNMGWKLNQSWQLENAKHIQQVLTHIKKNGACRSADFVGNTEKNNGWWDWKPEKRSLEVLFTTGQVMVDRRQGFQRVYDLTERVHPTWQDQRDLGKRAHDEENQVLDAVRALGITQAQWIADYFRMKKLAHKLSAQALADRGLLQVVRVEGWQEDFYVHPAHKDLLNQAQAGQLKASLTTLLSPFDPIVWDRKRALDFFHFDYKIECYTPQSKRQYGYFTLPILRRGKLIGRIDAKAHRKIGVMEIKALHLEAEVNFSEALGLDLKRVLKRFSDWHATPELQIGYCSDAGLRQFLTGTAT